MFIFSERSAKFIGKAAGKVYGPLVSTLNRFNNNMINKENLFTVNRRYVQYLALIIMILSFLIVLDSMSMI